MTTITYCSCCGSFIRPFGTCPKKHDAPAVTGPMADAIAQQGVYLAAQKAAPPAPAPTPVAPIAAPASRPARAPWQRRCTCGHCMACIGE